MGNQCKQAEKISPRQPINLTHHPSTKLSHVKQESPQVTLGIILNSTQYPIRLILTESQHKIENINFQTQYKASGEVAVGLDKFGIEGKIGGEHKIEKNTKAKEIVSSFKIVPNSVYVKEIKNSLFERLKIQLFADIEKNALFSGQIKEPKDLRFVVLYKNNEIYVHKLAQKEFSFACRLYKKYYDPRNVCEHSFQPKQCTPKYPIGCYKCLKLRKFKTFQCWQCRGCKKILCKPCFKEQEEQETYDEQNTSVCLSDI